MAHFPLFINLKGRRCIVAGAGAVGSRKIRALLDFGALVTVFDPSPSEEGRSLCPPAHLEARDYGDPSALAGAALAVAATNQRRLNQKLAQDAAARGIPVNVADDPGLCTFFFPALVRRGDVVAGISTAGGCPALAGRLRQCLDRLWRPDLGEALETLKAARQGLRARGSGAEDLRPALDALIERLGLDRGAAAPRTDTTCGPR
ncbi:MAG: bifunctional precorrin-2 dehydrogenase/sirohydrochlorin ferrochelatase [Spirochaetaceae bacterium]|jgi:siroheme synthase-like protein|nr:bifunctional precorrin-2 dehydrogenase/sirohydrochlorin ferrochelatase [Spirochaetaceae bacterium]